MGKKNKGVTSNLGRALIKDRFGGSKHKKFVSDNSMLHTTEIQDGYDWGRLNLQSVTEESSFQEFLSTAELAGTEFQAEKLNIKFVNPRSNVGLLTKDERNKASEDFLRNKEFIKIPRRPAWNAQTTPEQLQLNEKDAFLEWRRSLAMLQEDKGLLLTPYEKNLEFWRQLWRVVERSDVVVQIVDGRNPLLFRCEDLEKYVNEVSEDKLNMILVNKADFLTDEQRQYWTDYFTNVGIRVAFFSAVLATEKEAIQEESEDEDNNEEADSSDVETKPEVESNKTKVSLEDIEKCVDRLMVSVEEQATKLDEISDKLKMYTDASQIVADNADVNTNELLSRDGLIELFKKIHKGPKITKDKTTIGLVGYPNVGKSSTINALMTVKKVSVSATPGKTKHFQTLFLDKDLQLCDCPGLVMPSFVYTKAEMVVNGILPIDQMRDHVPPVNLVTSLIPRYIIEDKYGILLPLPMEGEDETRPPTAEELLNAYGYNRGFMTANGQPDNPRAARYILKDFMNGKLLFATAPPTVDQKMYHTWQEKQKIHNEKHVQPARQIRASKPNRVTTEDLDKMFFRNSHEGAHSKGKLGKPSGIPSDYRGGNSSPMASMESSIEKPWKKINKHENKKKKEKLRRVYAHLDQH